MPKSNEVKHKGLWVVLFGDPFYGFDVAGPFATEASAEEAAGLLRAAHGGGVATACPLHGLKAALGEPDDNKDARHSDGGTCCECGGPHECEA